MGDKDKAVKALLRHNDIFADIVNVCVYGGRHIVKEDELKDVESETEYASDGTLHTSRRDVVKLWKGRGIMMTLVGMEHQSRPDRRMPFRMMVYDGSAYLKASEKGVTPRLATFVLHMGRRKWNAPLSVLDAVEGGRTEDEWSPFMHDYGINLLDVAGWEEEKIELLESDFRIVADYLSQLRHNRKYRPSRKVIRHVTEVMSVLDAYEGTGMFNELDIYADEEEEPTMEGYITGYVRQQIAEQVAVQVREQVAVQVREQVAVKVEERMRQKEEELARSTREESAVRMIGMGFDDSTIAAVTTLSPERVAALREERS